MIYPEVIAACAAYAKHYGIPSTVFYPGCGSDRSPSEAFRDSTVIYCDPYKPGLDEILLEDARAIVLNQKAEDLPPGAKYDLVLNVHSHGPFEAQIRDLRSGGHLLIKTKMSEQAFASHALEFVGVVMPRNDTAMCIEEAGLEKYLEREPEHIADPRQPRYAFTNGRLHKAPYYVFRKK